MVHRPLVYAEMLRAKMLRHKAACWLVNTGWTGGSFGVGKRISIRHTRALLNDALSGALQALPFRTDPVFGFQVPLACEGVPNELLDPALTWPSRAEYDARYDALAARFIENFKLFAEGCPREVIAAGPSRAGRAAGV
jgi:phosphoenolpyruvate carboxykinase (ATP)